MYLEKGRVSDCRIGDQDRRVENGSGRLGNRLWVYRRFKRIEQEK